MQTKNMMFRYKQILVVLAIVAGITFSGCDSYLDIPLPVDRISSSSAFTNDKSCSAALNAVYGTLSGGSWFDGQGVGYKSGLYTDELVNLSVSEVNIAIYTSVVAPGQISEFWTTFYAQIYRLNMALEGISASTSILNHREQWLGEAYFLRALLHFYLANVYGEVPIVTTSDYKVNNTLKRSPVEQVYQQVTADLKLAEQLLPAAYADVNGNTTTDRARPNKAAATAFLARVYLYTKQWKEAEEKATDVIKQTTLYELGSLANTFTIAGNKETIAALAPLASLTLSPYVKDRYIYLNALADHEIPSNRTISSYGVNGMLSQSMLASFEPGDQRYQQWVYEIFQVNNGDTTRFFIPDKYKSRTNGQEYVVLIRLAELFLIRAEARAELGNIDGAQDDIDVLRLRAGLGNTPAAATPALVTAVMQERRVELFTEEGHRLFDLRRRGLLDGVMEDEVLLKNGVWESFQQYWPISPSESQANPNILQTHGY